MGVKKKPDWDIPSFVCSRPYLCVSRHSLFLHCILGEIFPFYFDSGE